MGQCSSHKSLSWSAVLLFWQSVQSLFRWGFSLSWPMGHPCFNHKEPILQKGRCWGYTRLWCRASGHLCLINNWCPCWAAELSRHPYKDWGSMIKKLSLGVLQATDSLTWKNTTGTCELGSSDVNRCSSSPQSSSWVWESQVDNSIKWFSLAKADDWASCSFISVTE